MINKLLSHCCCDLFLLSWPVNSICKLFFSSMTGLVHEELFVKAMEQSWPSICEGNARLGNAIRAGQGWGTSLEDS